jgi:hypothetical protein
MERFSIAIMLCALAGASFAADNNNHAIGGRSAARGRSIEAHIAGKHAVSFESRDCRDYEC